MNDLVTLEGGRPPAIFTARKSTMNFAAQQGVQASFAVIGYKGRNWRIKYRGDETLLTSDGRTPLPNLDVVVVGVSPHISKQFYEKRYTEGSDAAPDCFSVNGITPDISSPKKQCSTCGVCPNNAWGSRITEDGKKGKACQDSRRIAVVPLGDLENETYGGPMMLRLPPMSLTSLANYAGMLERKSASLEFVATRLGFDYDVAYPRITFEAVGWLNDEQARVIVGDDGNGGVCADPLVDRMLQEAVTETTHDPAVAQEEAEVADPLAGGGPAKVFAQPATPAVAVPAATVTPTAAPQPVAASSAPKPAKKPSPFQAVAQQNAAQQAVAQVQPAQQQVAPAAVVAAATVVTAAPDDMQRAIDELLDAPVAA